MKERVVKRRHECVDSILVEEGVREFLVLVCIELSQNRRSKLMLAIKIKRPEWKWSFAEQVEVRFKPVWRTEPLCVARHSDDFAKAVKSESNFRLAGSRRKIFKYRVDCVNMGGRALHGIGGPWGLPISHKLRMLILNICSQNAGEKLRRSKGKQPWRIFKVPNFKFSLSKMFLPLTDYR